MLIIGHRGAVANDSPENTLASVDRALREGADGVEIDVRLTADGVPVCHHDPGLWRTAGDARHVVSLRAAQLPRVHGHAVPRLAEVIDLVADRGRLVVELKTPRWPAGAAHATVNAVMTELSRHRLHDVVVSSFDRPRLLRVQGYRAPVRTALLGRPGLPLAVLLRRAAQDRHEEAHAHIASLLGRLELVRPAAQQGISVSGWTVNLPSELARLRDAGVAAAICDEPRLARAALPPRPLATAS